MMLPLLLLSLLAVQDAPAQDPLAPAREGKIRCIAPNVEAHTCRTMIRYTLRDNGGFDTQVTGIVQPDPLVVLQYESFGRVEDGGVCSMVRLADFEKGKLLGSSKAPLTRTQEQAVRLQLLGAIQPIAGRKRCFLDHADPAGGRIFTSAVTIDGVAQTDLQQSVAWVAPDEGFALGL